MPANLPPEYIEAELRYRAAKTPQEKLRALKEMLSLVPKHKGTETLRVDLKRRLAKLQKEVQRKPQAARGPARDHIEREGAGQIVLAGLPNGGKSSLLAAVTRARPQIADYPFSTFRPTVGMMPFEDVQIQLVDLPPLSEFAEGWVYSLIRNADAVALLIDLSAPDPDPEELLLETLALLERARIRVVPPGRPDPSAVGAGAGTVKRGFLLGTKLDAPGASERLARLREGAGLPVVGISIRTSEGLNAMKRLMFEALSIVRVYTKKPGQPPAKETPDVVPRGSTVLEVAERVHHDLARKFKYARVWGSAEYPGQRVERAHVVQDGDIIEIHT